MQHLRNEPRWSLLYGCGAAALVVFLLIQVLPTTASSFFGIGGLDVIDKAEAEANAAAFVKREFGEPVRSAAAVHQSQRVFYGYLAKEKQLDTFEKLYDADYPTDTYQVEVRGAAGGQAGRVVFVHVHMESGRIVAWNEMRSGAGEQSAALPYDEAVREARSFAVQQGFREEELQPREQPLPDGAVVFDVAGATISDAQLALTVRVERAAGGQPRIVVYKPAFEVPDSYVSYVNRQDSIAQSATLIGSMGMSVVMAILAIVYAALYRRHTSFKRGLLLSAVFLLFYGINNYNMYDGVRAGLGETANAQLVTGFMLAFQMLIIVGIAASVYFSLVAGDGLWRQMGRNLWPRRGEPGFGDHIWQSMKLGYLFAIIILGLQSIILIVWQKGTGSWSTTDVTQSPLNFSYGWLFPLLAWCAAISEEAVYRLFGIAIFKKWFRNTAVAAIVPTIVWALGHVAYPIYPWSTRLVELTLLGLLFCYLFIRYGFATVVFAHAIMNSILMSLSLIFTGAPVDIVAGVAYIVLPLAVAWVMRRFGGRTAGAPA